MKRIFLWLRLRIVLVLLAGTFPASGQSPERTSFDADVRALLAAPHRLAGSAEGRAAGDYILGQIGPLRGEVLVQRFHFPQEMVTRCELQAGGQTFALEPLEANGLQPSTTGPAGIRGHLVDLGNGSPALASGKKVAGSIVIIDLESDGGARFALAAGAQAVIFVGGDNPDRRWAYDKATHVSVDLPRFYVGPSEGAALRAMAGAEALVISEVSWQDREGRNLFLLVPGTQPVFEGTAEEFVILSAPYDSDGLVPTNSPSPDRAANVAALLDLARSVSEHPARRNVLFAFFDNHANFEEGARHFYAALRRSIPEGITDPLPVRREFVNMEKAHLTSVLEELALPDVLARRNTVADGIRAKLRVETKARYDSLQEEIGALRLRAKIAAREDPESPEAARLEAAIAELRTQQRGWQALREAVRDRTIVPPAHEALWHQAVENFRGTVQARRGELDALEQSLEDSLKLMNRIGGWNPVLHAGLRFTSGNTRWLFLEPGRTRTPLAETLQAASPELADPEAPASWFNRRETARASVPWNTIEAPAFAETFGIPALTAVTEQDRAPFAGMPGVQPHNLEAIQAQAQAAGKYFRLAMDTPKASTPNRILRQTRVYLDDYQWLGDRADGHMVKSIGFGETAPSDIERNAMVQIMGRAVLTGPETPRYVSRSDSNGIFPINQLLITDSLRLRDLTIEGALFDDAGKISSISALSPAGGRGSVEAGWTAPSFFQTQADTGFFNVVALFSGSKGALLGRDLAFAGPFRARAFNLLNGVSDGAFSYLNFQYDPRSGLGGFTTQPSLPAKLLYHDSTVTDGVALYLDPPTRFLAEKTANPTAVINLDEDMAAPMVALNESRLAGLRKRNIILDSLEELHLAAREQLGLAQAATSVGDFAAARSAFARSASLERRVYRPVKDTIGDMVRAVTLLLVMAVPFSAAAQALLFPTPSVYRRVGIFGAIFLLCFLGLYFTHPAFSFSAFPVVILLAFILMVMSGAVIGIIAGKFSAEIKNMQGLAISAHTMRRSALGNVGAAFSLAISTMRRRPARTVLTVVTVLLLTFTILSFVSFQQEKGVNEIYLGAASQPGGAVLIRQRVWQALPNDLDEGIRPLTNAGFDVARRSWQAQELTNVVGEELDIPLRAADGNLAEANGILGLDRREWQGLPDLQAALPAEKDVLERFFSGQGIFLPPALARQLAIGPGATLRMLGRELEVLGVFDATRLQQVRQIDGGPILPINFRSTRLAMGAFESASSAAGGAENELEEEISRLEPEAFEPVSADSVVLVGDALAREMGVPLRAISLFPLAVDGGRPAEIGREMALLSDFGTYVQEGGERRWFRFGDKIGVVGLGDVLVPLLIGGLIVFSTMLGSIIDREKEIYTFSALGLAPRNIAMLFFVESGVYAILGGFGGYLLGQAAALLLDVLSQLGWFPAPEVNYSSSTAINTILLVIGVVLVSTVYPALQAAKKATADTSKRWKIPKAADDRIEMPFPFTVSSHHLGGVFGFIEEHLESHSDRTIGSFAASGTTWQTDEANGWLRAKIWLQPFDQGISQDFEIRAKPSDIEEVSEISISVARISGPPTAWQRALPGFLEDIRKQFLLWRALSDEVMDNYLNRAQEGAQSPSGVGESPSP